MPVAPETAPQCPQCNHPVTKNATTCPGCNRFYHEICLKQGCSCGGKAKGQPDHLVAAEFFMGLAGVGAAAWLRGSRASDSPLFWPAIILGAVGFLATLTRKIHDPTMTGTGHLAAQVLFLPALAAMVVAGRGVEFPGFVAAVAVGAIGLLVALWAILKDAERSTAALALMLAAHTYLVAGVALTPRFPERAFERLRAVAKGKASITGPLGQHAAGKEEKAFRVSGVMLVGGNRRALTSAGAVSAGQTIPDVGKVVSVSDAEVVIQTTDGAIEHHPVPR